MISFCVKSTNKKTLDELELYFDATNIPNIYYSQKEFKKFYNFIFHYIGSDEKFFYNELSKLLTNFIIKNYENKFINSELKYDFFYFSAKERNYIYNCVVEALNTKTNFTKKFNILQNCILNFNDTCRRYNIEGLINFRIHEYKLFLKSILEKKVHNYVVEKEYTEYINLLKEYIQVQSPQIEKIHLIYTENEKLLMDSLGNIITTTASKKYLSDISFSTNDFILNSIISLIPKNLVVHSHCEEDNFLKFLKQIFEGKYSICNDCTICKKYLLRSKNFFINN